MSKILTTGGAGFIGSNLFEHFLGKGHEVICLDNFATGHQHNIKSFLANSKFTFIEGDNRDFETPKRATENVDYVLHQAALGSVLRSIYDPITSNEVNVSGFLNMLVASKDVNVRFFIYAASSTIYGDSEELPKVEDKIGKPLSSYAITKNVNELYAEIFNKTYGLETIGLRYFNDFENRQEANFSYSASKAASDHYVRASEETYGLPHIIANYYTNYGTNHFPEKLIPLFIYNNIEKKPLLVYGDGKDTCDWLFVEDHVEASDLVFHEGKNHETYNIGGFNEWQNIYLVQLLCIQMDAKLEREECKSEKLFTHVKHRRGHDLRYAIDASKINKELGWTPSVTFEQGLEKTIDWYLSNEEWLKNVTSGEYQKYYEEQYK